jgi:hypothetical protein
MRYVTTLLAFLVVAPVFAQSPQEASSTVGARYVEPSAKTPLKAGEKIESLFTRNMKQRTCCSG